MLEDNDLAAGWQVWNADERRLILAYRPDVFDGGAFPHECLPTIYVTQGRRNRRPGTSRDPDPDAPWMVTLFFEPEVDAGVEKYPTREAAVEGACELARRFSRGDVDYREVYQLPREEYFAKLDELTGQG